MSKKAKVHKKAYFIRGMHCSTCEILISQDVKNLSGVQDVEVSLSESKVVVHAKSDEDVPSPEHLNELFADLGYTFHENKPKVKPIKKNDIAKIILIAVLFIFLFYTFEKSGVLGKYTVDSSSSFSAFFIFGLAAGVSSCAALTGGLLLSLSKKWNELYGNNAKKSFIPFLYFNASRIIAFALLGGVLGLLGSFLKISITLMAILAILISILMLIIGLQMLGINWFKKFSFNFLDKLTGGTSYLDKNKNFEGKYVPIIIGALTFLIPCGFTIIAQTMALASGSFYQGFMQLLFFSLGTLPVLILISFSGIKFYSNPAFSQKFTILSGTLIIFFALYTFNSQLNVLGLKSLNDITFAENPADSSSVLNDGTGSQVMQMEARGFEYYPKEIVIRSGIKTVWNIYEDNALGCAKAVYARGLYNDVIYLKPGLNSVEFIAPKKGTYKISCSMGMVAPVTVKVI